MYLLRSIMKEKIALNFERFDIAFKNQDIGCLSRFEQELGSESSHGSYQEDFYIAGFTDETDPDKLIKLFKKYKAEGLVEEGSMVKVSSWLTLDEYEKAIKGMEP